MGLPCQDLCTPWATAEDLPPPCNGTSADPGLVADALEMASEVLFEFTRRRWPGLCSDTVRPCASGCRCSSPNDCGCGSLSEVDLVGPIAAVTEVKIDGVVLDASRYRVDEYRWLVRLADADGGNPGWPCCQRLDLADDQDRTFAVTYEYGLLPPTGGKRAAASLACQLILAFDPDSGGECRLPKRVTTLTRQGVTIAVVDPLTLFASGLTGLAEVDMWVAAVNRGSERRRATVIDPLRAQRFRRVDT